MEDDWSVRDSQFQVVFSHENDVCYSLAGCIPFTLSYSFETVSKSEMV